MSELRIKRRIMWDETKKLLEDHKYAAWRCFLTRQAMYMVLVIAINHLAVLTKRNPYRVYQVIYLNYRNTLKGAKFRESRISTDTLRVLLEDDGGRECCGWCGKPIGSAPPPDDKTSKPRK